MRRLAFIMIFASLPIFPATYYANYSEQLPLGFWNIFQNELPLLLAITLVAIGLVILSTQEKQRTPKKCFDDNVSPPGY
jgi:hypothetical protein